LVRTDLVTDLATVQFRHLPGTTHLRVKATAQIVGKVLYLVGEGRTTDQLVREAATLLGVARLPQSDIEAGCTVLQGAGLVEKKKTHWRLTERGAKQLERD